MLNSVPCRPASTLPRRSHLVLPPMSDYIDSEQYIFLQYVLNDNIDEDMEAAAAITGVTVGGALISHEDHIRRHRMHRFYLTRPQLLQNPRTGTPAMRVIAGRDNRAYVTTMGFDVETFDYLLHEGGFKVTWENTPISWEDVSYMGQPRLGARSLNAQGALGLALYFMSSAMHEIALQQIFALVPSSTSRYINHALDILLDIVETIPEGKIEWWTDEEFFEDNALITARHSLLDGAVGSVDGLSLTSAVSSDHMWSFRITMHGNMAIISTMCSSSDLLVCKLRLKL
jgi:hypothetical protein